LAAHVIQRSNNHQAIFFESADYELYLSLLLEGRDRYQCAVHAYVLMTNHVYLLVTPLEKGSVSRMMQYVGRHYVPYINAKYARSGTLWEGRFKASIVDSASYLLACYRYIELNPVRAGMVVKPQEYRWSSFHGSALALPDGLLTPHAEYVNLWRDERERAINYGCLFEQPQQEGVIAVIREHIQSGTPLGSESFRSQIESILFIKVGNVSRGRPRREC
jgi:putative transposase